MNIIIVLVVFLEASLFSLFHFNIRKLEEKGVTSRGIAGLHRYAIIPSAILLVATFKVEYWHYMLAHPVIFLWIVGIGIAWAAAQYVGYAVLNSASSLSFTYTLNALLDVPVALAAGIILNHDHPHLWALVGLAFLALAILVKPAQSVHNKRSLLKYGVLVVIGMSLVGIVGHAIDGGLYRNILLSFPHATLFGASVYMTVTSFMLNIVYYLPGVKGDTDEERKTIKKYWWTAALIPVIWFIASVPEGFAFAHVPLFTLSALGAFTFLLNLASDIKNARVSWNMRTFVFVLLVIASIVFSALSL
ncbi:MAG: hypothetical protein JWM20_926 [Patescibacteria group bacterium]|nr:hypothetical protein [Patescibacteria group bacterium]